MTLQKRVNRSWDILKNRARIAGAVLATAGSTLVPSFAVAQAKQPVEQSVTVNDYVNTPYVVKTPEGYEYAKNTLRIGLRSSLMQTQSVRF